MTLLRTPRPIPFQARGRESRKTRRVTLPCIAALLLLCTGTSLAAGMPAAAESAAWHADSSTAQLPHGTTLPEHAIPESAMRARLDPALFTAERLSVPLTESRLFHAIRRQSRDNAQGGKSVTGDFAGLPGSFFALTEHAGQVTGFLQTSSELWEVKPVGAGEVLIYRVDPAQIPPEAAPLQVAGENGTIQSPEAAAPKAPDALDSSLVSTTSTVSAGLDVPYQHDLLVVYTPRAAANAGGQASIQGAISNAVAAANAGYSQSGIALSLNLVGMAETPYAENGDFYTSLARLSGTQDGYMDEIHALRDRLKADIVILASEDSSWCGLAYMMGAPSTGFAPSAFGVVRPLCFSNHSLAHEIGHIQGNDHDRLNGIGGSFPWSFGYRTCDGTAPTNGQSFRSIMSYSCGSVPRINYFSNPRVLFNGAAMGIDYETDPANAADNARSMTATAAAVAGFRTDAPVLYAPVAPAPASVAPGSLAVIQWTNVANETGYDVIRETWNSRKNLWSATTTRVAADTTSLTASLASGTYRYRVRAFNAVGTSNPASALCATCGSDGSFSVAGSKSRR